VAIFKSNAPVDAGECYSQGREKQPQTPKKTGVCL